MTKPHLRACPGCARHVRVSEEACPFCKSALAQSFRASPAPQPPRSRLTRAALFAFGTSTAALTAACGSSSSQADAGQEAVDAAYGGPPVETLDAAYGGPPIELDSGPPIETVDAAYGGPPIEHDAGPDSASDASEDAPSVIVDAAYGGPPLDSGHD